MDIPNPVKIRGKALEEVKKILKKKGIPSDYGLRVGIKGAGCSGMGFLLGFDKETESDLSYSIDGINVLIERKHAMYVVGLEVDFYEGSDARGFTFVNPDSEEPKSEMDKNVI